MQPPEDSQTFKGLLSSQLCEWGGSSLPRLHIPTHTRSLPASKYQSEMRGSHQSMPPPGLDTLISTCTEFKGSLSVSMNKFLVSMKKRQRSLLRAHREMRKKQGSWRTQPLYSAKRNDIKGALSDRNNQVKEKEVQLLQYIIGFPESPKSSFSLVAPINAPSEGFSYKDLMSTRMSQLLSLNKRDFGQTYSGTPLRLADKSLKAQKKVRKFKTRSDNAMLKREIIRFRRQDLEQITKNIPPPAVILAREKAPSIPLNDAQLQAMSPLNRFIFKQHRRFQPKSTHIPRKAANS